MKLLRHSIFPELMAQANASPRARAHHNIHDSSSDPVQRFFVVANRASYFRPHRHAGKCEMAVVLKGAFDVLIFDETGCVTARHAIGEGTPNLGYETPQATWHTLMARADGAAFLEIKQGPYDPATASEFAPWAPQEGHERVAQYLTWLRNAQPQDRYTLT
jgi:cupin fold WbuC family metalloprotein